jgi:hypothetical protein
MVLEQPAQQAGVALFRGDRKRQALTIRIDDAPLSEALATLLVGVRYSLESFRTTRAGSPRGSVSP